MSEVDSNVQIEKSMERERSEVVIANYVSASVWDAKA